MREYGRLSAAQGSTQRSFVCNPPFAVNDASVTVNFATQATAMMDGTFKFANGTNFRVADTIAKQFSQISWPAE